MGCYALEIMTEVLCEVNRVLCVGDNEWDVVCWR